MGAEITGVDGSTPLDDGTIAAIRQAWLDNIVVYLPGQDLAPEQFLDFCRQFGELDVENMGTIKSRHPDMPELLVRSNKPIAGLGSREVPKSGAADKWHTDFAQAERPTTIAFLLAKAMPSVGGDTMFSNLSMAYEALSPAFQHMLDPLVAVHGSKPNFPPVVHPLVQVHPETGRKLLYLSERITHFAGMTEEETKPILDFLQAHATRYEFLYRHRWTTGDLLIWDNRCSLHIAVQDYAPELRFLMRCSLNGPKTGKVLARELQGTAKN